MYPGPPIAHVFHEAPRRMRVMSAPELSALIVAADSCPRRRASAAGGTSAARKGDPSRPSTWSKGSAQSSKAVRVIMTTTKNTDQ